MAASGKQYLQATFAFNVTPNDSGSLSSDVANTPGYQAGCIWITGAGAVKVRTMDGVDITWAAVPANSILGAQVPLLVSKVYLTGTAATGIVALCSKDSIS